GQTEGGEAGTGVGEQRVDVTVITTRELHDLRPSGESARETDGAHRRLGAGVDEPDLLDGCDAGDDLLGEFDLTLGGGTERQTRRRGGSDSLDDRRMRVPENHRAPR